MTQSKEEVMGWYLDTLQQFKNKKLKMTIKAIKKPVVIKFQQVTEDELPNNVELFEKDGKYRVWNNLHQSWIEVKIGDYINIENSNDNYPVDVEYFKNNYEIV